MSLFDAQKYELLKKERDGLRERAALTLRLILKAIKRDDPQGVMMWSEDGEQIDTQLRTIEAELSRMIEAAEADLRQP